MRTRHTQIGELLRSQGRLRDDQLAAALEYKRSKGVKLGQALVALGLVTESDLAQALRKQGKVVCIRLTPGIVDVEVAALLGAERSEEFRALPINRIAGVTTVAMEDPSDVYRVDQLARLLNTQVLAVHAEADRIEACRSHVFGKKAPPGDSLSSIVDQALQRGLGVQLESAKEVEEAVEADGDLDAPVINLIRSTLEEAYNKRASDIHFEVHSDRMVVRFRVDGSLFERLSVPRSWARPCVARLKILASMDIAQRRLPQDGRAQAAINGRQVDLRVATTPSLHGEGAVIRILDGGRELRDLHSLDLDPQQLAGLESMCDCTDGFVLATGPTGSGKTTTLYAMLKRLHNPDTKIITLEDPVENQLEGATQINTNAKIGLTFARGLRSILRQDPDVVLVGEVRDEETAQISVQAALTGHLVLSTLHTLGAAETITRLEDMGIEAYLLADVLRGIVSQRLVRRICVRCRRESQDATRWLERLEAQGEHGATRFFEGAGCEECNGTGFRGRVGLYEVLPMTATLCDGVRARRSTRELYQQALAQGLVTLRADGLRKARLGHTTLSEVFSVTKRM